ncbi:MAG: AglZ/HisF2 family acetamidino modification protein [Opitutales bacterium]
MRPRVIPQLLLHDRGLYKGQRFRKPQYVGDPLNTVKLFNDMAVDELIITDIFASSQGYEPDFDYLEEVASEAFMPMSYGGGITSLEQMAKIFSSGFEKVILNTSALRKPQLIREAADKFGSQSIVISLDYKKGIFSSHNVYIEGARKKLLCSLEEAVARSVDQGAGEIIICSVDREGLQQGYDISVIRSISKTCQVPLIASGGAGSLDHLLKAYEAGASAMAAGSLFIYQGPYRAVLINYPDDSVLDSLFGAA